MRLPHRQTMYVKSGKIGSGSIAAGFVNHDGVLLCADTLTTDSGAATIYRSKIIPVFLGDGKVFFAFSGDIKFAESVIQRCEKQLKKYNGEPRSIGVIADTVQGAWVRLFKDTHSDRNTLSQDQIICAIQSQRDREVALYSSVNQSFAESVNAAEYIGVGDWLTRYLAGPPLHFSSTRALSRQHVFELALSAIARVKEFMPTAVGGNLTAVGLNKDGSETLYSQAEIERLEKYTGRFNGKVKELLLRLMDLQSPSGFDNEADRLIFEIKEIRRQWEGQLTGKALLELPPIEITDAFWRAQNSA